MGGCQLFAGFRFLRMVLEPNPRRKRKMAECTYLFTSQAISYFVYFVLSIRKHFKGVCFRDIVIGSATPYELDDPGVESGCWRDFPHPSRTAFKAHLQPPVKWLPGLYSGVERPGRGVDQPQLSSAEVKERVELYFYYLSVPL